MPDEAQDGPRGATPTGMPDEPPLPAAIPWGRHVAVRVLAAAVLLLVVFALLADAREARRLLHEGDWEFLLPALLCTLASYACLAEGYAQINCTFGIPLPRRELAEVGFLSYALSNLVSMGGLAGYSLRLFLLRRRGVRAGDVLGAAVMHSMLNQLAIFLLLPAGLFELLVRHPLGRERTAEVAAAGGLSLGVLAALLLFLFHGGVRRRVVEAGALLAHRVTRRPPHDAFHETDEALARGTATARRRPGPMSLAVVLVIADWGTSLATLGFCFRTFGESLPLGVLLTGFSIGVAAGVVSMVPGGLGVQDGSMVGMFALLGVPLEHAILASVLFRLVYYVAPFLVSLPLYGRALRRPFVASAARKG